MRVTLNPDGISFSVSPHERLLDAARRAGIELPHACRGGRCGLCAARCLAGTTAYPDGEPAAAQSLKLAPGAVLLCRAVAASDISLELAPVRIAGSAGLRRLPARVRSIERLGDGLAKAWLALPRVEPFAFRAGQYLNIVLDEGVRRSYSIASPPHDAQLIELHLRRGRSGGAGAELFDRLAPKLLLEVEGPHGNFVYREPAPGVLRPLLLVAGGTGFAPVKSILRHVLDGHSPRPLSVYWGARSRADLYDHDWLCELAAREPGLRYVPVLAGEAVAGFRHGLVHEALIDDHAELGAAEVYAAGPPPMLEALAIATRARGLPAAQFHHDRPTG